MRKVILVSVLAVLCAAPAMVAAHPGGKNRCGCHVEKKTGECHCHPEAGNGTCGCDCQAEKCPAKGAEKAAAPKPKK